MSQFFTFKAAKFSHDNDARQDLLEAAFCAHLAILNGVAPGDLRWLNPSWDFFCRDAEGRKIPMDAFTVLALFRASYGQRLHHPNG